MPTNLMDGEVGRTALDEVTTTGVYWCRIAKREVPETTESSDYRYGFAFG